MELRTIDGIRLAVLDTRLDAYAAKQAGPALDDVCQRGVKKLLFDFSRTEYISSAGLRLLIATEKKMQESGGRCVLFSLQPNVRRVFEIAGVTHLFSISDSEEEALKSVG
jgi:anti-anti-sigma factor